MSGPGGGNGGTEKSPNGQTKSQKKRAKKKKNKGGTAGAGRPGSGGGFSDTTFDGLSAAEAEEMMAMEMMMGGGMPGGSMPGAGRSAPRSAGRKDGRRGGRGSGEGDDEEMVRAMMEMMMGGGGGAMPSGGGEAGMAEMMAAMMAGGFDEDDEMIRGELGSLQLHSPVNESHIAPLILGVCVCVQQWQVAEPRERALRQVLVPGPLDCAPHPRTTRTSGAPRLNPMKMPAPLLWAPPSRSKPQAYSARCASWGLCTTLKVTGWVWNSRSSKERTTARSRACGTSSAAALSPACFSEQPISAWSLEEDKTPAPKWALVGHGRRELSV